MLNLLHKQTLIILTFLNIKNDLEASSAWVTQSNDTYFEPQLHFTGYSYISVFSPLLSISKSFSSFFRFRKKSSVLD